MTYARRWHRHYNLLCVRCGVLVYKRAVCVRSNRGRCPIRRLVVCPDCRRQSPSVPDDPPGTPYGPPQP